MAEENKTTDTKSPEPEKTYTQKDLLLYCGITGLITGVIGYFIGESRGEKKSKDKFEFAINQWQKKTKKQKKNKDREGKNDSDQEFVL